MLQVRLVVVHVFNGSSTAAAVYERLVPPLAAAADHEMIALPFTARSDAAVTPVGAPGAPGAATAAEAVDAALSPALFVAFTVNV